jgi:nonsense-mediated mRNA decay protein 3
MTTESTPRAAPCPRCGNPLAPDDERVDPDGVVCDACYLDDIELVAVPETLTIEQCTGCHAVRRDGDWERPETDDHVGLAVEAVTETLQVHVQAREIAWSVDPEPVDHNTVAVDCLVAGQIGEHPVEATVTVRVTFADATCQRCGRIAADDYASIVQVRATDRETTGRERERATELASAYVADRDAAGDREAYVTEVSETDGGLDIKCSTPSLGRAIADRIVAAEGGTVGEARRLVTEDGDGNEVYRMAYAVRLPPFRPDDVIDPGDDEGPVLVERVGDRLHGRRLATGAAYETAATDSAATKLGTVDDAVETTLVAIEDENAVQVLDPETYAATTIARPAGLDGDRDTVRVFRTREGLYPLPDD